jgi:hypothetical protein
MRSTNENEPAKNSVFNKLIATKKIMEKRNT